MALPQMVVSRFLADLHLRYDKERGGYGIVGDIVIGLIGALIGGFLAGLLGLGQFGLIGSIIVAFIEACIMIAILRAVSGAGRRRRRRRSFQTAVSPGEKGSTLPRD